MSERPARPRILRPHDLVVLAYLVVEAALVVLFAPAREDRWPLFLAAHAAMAAGLLLLAWLAVRFPGRVVRAARDWYPALYILLIFAQLGSLVPAVNPTTWDATLLSWDRATFGAHPSVFFDGVAGPGLTEVLRACWLSYFILPFVVAAPLYLRRDRAAFHETVLVLVSGWLVSFLGYFAFPALGPGYFPLEVPAPDCVTGSGPTQSVAQALFALEGRMHDVFPSGHTIIALLCLRQAVRHRLRGWPSLVPLVAGLLAATVYLRYHYGVDVIAGALIAGAVAALAPCAPRPASGVLRPASGVRRPAP